MGLIYGVLAPLALASFGKKEKPGSPTEKPFEQLKEPIDLAYAARIGDWKKVQASIELTPMLLKMDFPRQITPLHWAATHGQQDRVIWLIGRGAVVDAPDFHGRTPLHNACENGHLEVVRVLIEAGAALDAKDSKQQTPLHTAVEQGHVSVAKILVARGAKVNPSSPGRLQPIHLAARHHHNEILKMLIKRGAHINERSGDERSGDYTTPLHYAVLSANLEGVRYLVKRGALLSLNVRRPRLPLARLIRQGHWEIATLLLDAGPSLFRRQATTEKQGSNLWVALAQAGQTEQVKAFVARLKPGQIKDALVWAAEQGADDLLRFVLSSEAKIKKKDQKRLSNALVIAALNGHLECVKLLLNAGAQIDTKDKYGNTLLYNVTRKGQIHIAKYLIKKGADVLQRPRQGTTLLEFAIFEHDMEFFDLVLGGGVDINRRGSAGLPLLTRALNEDGARLAKNLIDRGAKLDQRGHDDRTALHHIAGQRRLDIAEFLIEQGATVDARCNSGKTPLHDAARKGDVEFAALLLANNADVNAKTIDMLNTPLHEAVRANKNRFEMIRLLLAKGADPFSRNANNKPPRLFASSEHDAKVFTIEYLTKTIDKVITDSKDCDLLFKVALRAENAQLVQILLDQRADPQHPHKHNPRPIHMIRSLAIVRKLVKAGAEVDQRLDPRGDTPLYFASLQPNGHELVAYLLEKGADPNAICRNGETPLHAAVKMSALKSVQLLLQNGARIDIKNQDGHVPGHMNRDKRIRRLFIIYKETHTKTDAE